MTAISAVDTALWDIKGKTSIRLCISFSEVLPVKRYWYTVTRTVTI